ncbi:MAG: hypothetical protein GC151_16055 [Betaproteobacteria bacterium]|nr:hypothetical protein [Betaproteobacteria bacterium]
MTNRHTRLRRLPDRWTRAARTVTRAAALAAPAFAAAAPTMSIEVSGGRAANTKGNGSDFGTAGPALWYQATERFSLGLAYTCFGEIAIAYPATQTVHQVSLIPAVSLPFSENRIPDAGLSIDLFRSRYRANGSVSVTDHWDTAWRAGAYVDVRQMFREGIHAGLYYRYAAPPGLSVHTFGVLPRVAL